MVISNYLCHIERIKDQLHHWVGGWTLLKGWLGWVEDEIKSSLVFRVGSGEMSHQLLSVLCFFFFQNIALVFGLKTLCDWTWFGNYYGLE